jgi:hypothetical protein
MTIVTFRNKRQQIMVDVPGSWTFTLPASGEAGEARFTVPYSRHPNLRDCIDPDAGSQLLVHGQGNTEPWHGVVSAIDYDVAGVQVTAHQPWLILGKRNVSNGRRFQQSNAGYIWGAAMREALGGIAGYPLRYTTITDTPPHVTDYQFTGQDVMSVAQDMMSISGMEIMHAPKSPILPTLCWGGIHARATFWPDLLIAGSSLLDEGFAVSLTERVARVTSRDASSHTFSASNAGVAAAGWPAEMSVQGGQSLGAMMHGASEELIRLAQPGLVITGGVPQLHPGTGTNLWNILERDFVRVHIPRARFSGATMTCRVLARTRSTDSHLETLALQVVSDPAGQIVQFRSSGAVRRRTSRGSGRAFPGRDEFHDLRRRIFDLESR